MAAFRELYLTILVLLFSQISGQWSGSSTIKQCGSSNLNIVFNFSLGSEHFFERYWYLNSTMNRIATVDSTGFLTVTPPFSSRVTLYGMNGITLDNANRSDSGIYLLIIITDSTWTFLTATTTVIINGMYDCSHSLNNVFCLFLPPPSKKGIVKLLFVEILFCLIKIFNIAF
ncbi:hypothetical protein ACJMK2_007058 [Sinanodonta woodiana]|uniref:Immunoglobulin subtype domain-containing protein n=1 Tax=Sinanodonta woodiana TaxID=1069815 RepID=A0ABD3VHA4_SINWO